MIFERVTIFGGPGQCAMIISAKLGVAKCVSEGEIEVVFNGKTIAIAYCRDRHVFPYSMAISMGGLETKSIGRFFS